MYRTSFIAGLVAVILLSFVFIIYAQGSSVSSLPDYSNWTQIFAGNWSAAHNGQTVNLKTEAYEHQDLPNLTYQSTLLVYDEQNRLWLAFYVIHKYADRGGNRTELVSAGFYLFENNSGKWLLAKDFSQSKALEKDTNDFLKSKYDLEFK